MGLLAAGFAFAPLISLAAIEHLHRQTSPERLNQLAWFGGVALFFITLIFPLQFERQWITISWALEGAALCWLFRRVPHRGLILTGTFLLGVVFVRLAINPAVLVYQERSGVVLFNWFLYTYGLAAAAQFAALKALRPPDHRLGEIDLRAVFGTFGGVLLFLLMNIEIADAFSPPDRRFVVFEFGGGHLARDMCYSIGWGLFALALLITGFKLRSRGVRYTGVGLMVVTLIKLFFHDLARIDSIYRIGALFAVALTAFFASFLYQRFLEREKEE